LIDQNLLGTSSVFDNLSLDDNLELDLSSFRCESSEFIPNDDAAAIATIITMKTYFTTGKISKPNIYHLAYHANKIFGLDYSENFVLEDVKPNIIKLLEVGKTIGCIDEEAWIPNSLESFNNGPLDNQDFQTKQLIYDYNFASSLNKKKNNVKLSTYIKLYLANNSPVAVNILFYSDPQDPVIASTGILDIVKQDPSSEPLISIWFTLIAYNEETNFFTVLSPFGSDWGFDGAGFIDEALIDDNTFCKTSFVIRYLF